MVLAIKSMAEAVIEDSAERRGPYQRPGDALNEFERGIVGYRRVQLRIPTEDPVLFDKYLEWIIGAAQQARGHLRRKGRTTADQILLAKQILHRCNRMINSERRTP